MDATSCLETLAEIRSQDDFEDRSILARILGDTLIRQPCEISKNLIKFLASENGLGGSVQADIYCADRVLMVDFRLCLTKTSVPCYDSLSYLIILRFVPAGDHGAS